jgi:hypothetical protein
LVDLTRREADLALRLRPPGKAPGEPSIVVTRLAAVGFALYGTRTAARASPPRFVRYAGYEPASQRVQAAAAEAVTSALVDDVPTALALAIAGCGLTVPPCFLGDEEPGLIRASEVLESHGLFLATTEELRRAPRVQRRSAGSRPWRWPSARDSRGIDAARIGGRARRSSAGALPAIEPGRAQRQGVSQT